jgi:hypothetical protein
MATGDLPFRDNSLQNLFHKIVTQDVTFPNCLSAALCDLLGQSLTIDRITSHDGIAKSSYFGFFSIAIGAKSADAIISPNITLTELTTVYRMMRRDRLTHTINEALSALSVALPSRGEWTSSLRAAFLRPVPLPGPGRPRWPTGAMVSPLPRDLDRVACGSRPKVRRRCAVVRQEFRLIGRGLQQYVG